MLILNRILLSTALLLFVRALAAETAGAPAVSLSPEEEGTAWFTKHTAQSFARTPAAKQEIDLSNFHQALLDAAVFHETNRRRKELRLPQLHYAPRVQEAARIQAEAMTRGGYVAHVNPDQPEIRALRDRSKKAGLDPAFVAENVASAFLLRYESGRKFYTRTENGEKIFSYRPDGPAIPKHTYLSFARALVERWMQSPGHRKNIVHEKPRALGCSNRPGTDDSGFTVFYCAQVFYQEMPPPRRPN